MEEWERRGWETDSRASWGAKQKSQAWWLVNWVGLEWLLGGYEGYTK